MPHYKRSKADSIVWDKKKVCTTPPTQQPQTVKPLHYRFRGSKYNASNNETHQT